MLLCIEELLLIMGLGFLGPILPKFVQSLGVEAGNIGFAVGAAMTAFGVARAGMDIPAGKLARRFGRRFLLVGAPAVVVASALGMAFTTAYWQLILWRILQGAGSAGFSVAALIVLGEISTPANRGFNISFFWSTFLIGSSLGPSFGGFMGEYLGYRAAFFCYAGLALTAALWGYLRIPETTSRNASAPATNDHPVAACPAPRKDAFFNPDFLLISLVSLFTLVSVAGTQVTLVPMVGYERLLLREGQVGIGLTVIAVMQLILTPLAGRFSDRLGRKTLIVPGGLIAALGLIMFVHSSNYWLFLLSAALLGVGRGFSGPIPTAYVADIAPRGSYESMLAAFRAVSDLGWVVGPLLCGYLKDVAGVNLPFYLTAGGLCLAVILFALVAEETVLRKEG